MSLSDVEAALLAKMSEVLEGVPTRWENTTFSPPSRARWAEVHFFPGYQFPDTVGAAGRNKAVGFIQVNFHYPRGSGEGAAASDHALIRGGFPAGYALTYGSQSVTPTECECSEGRQSKQDCQSTVTVYWYAFIPKVEGD